MDREEALDLFMNDPRCRMLRLWGEILYALRRKHNPTREELAEFVFQGGGYDSFWEQGMREHGRQ